MRVSVDSAGGQADTFAGPPGQSWGSFGAVLSGDGRHVAFSSNATDLVAGDTNGTFDVFVRDLWSGRTTRVSVGAGGAQVSGPSFGADISADGRYVLFTSASAGLPGADGGNRVYLHDQRRHLTMVVSGDGPENSSTGAVGTSLSDDGRRVAVLTGPAAGPVRAEVIDRRTGAVEVVSIGVDGVPVAPNGSVTMSGDGRTVMFGSGYTPSLYVRDLRAGTTRLLHAGPAYEGALSSDGRYAAYAAGNDVNDIHVEVVRTLNRRPRGLGRRRHRPGAQRRRALRGVFEGANTLSPIPGEPAAAGQGVYRYDRRTGAVQRVSVTPAGRPANNGSWFPDISADGRTVAFASAATDLVPGDTNDAEDIFARRLR